MQNGPQFIFADAGLQGILHRLHGDFAGRDYALHGINFIDALDDTRVLAHCLSAANFNAEPLESMHTRDLNFIDRQASVVTAVAFH